MARSRKKRKARSSSKAAAPTEISSTPCPQIPPCMQETRKKTVLGAQGISDGISTELNGHHAAGIKILQELSTKNQSSAEQGR